MRTKSKTPNSSKSPRPPNPTDEVTEKLYTYRVLCSFELQYTFPQSEVERDSDGDETDLSPTEAALAALGSDLTEVLGYNYVVSDFEAESDSNLLIGVLGDREVQPRTKRRRVRH
jgi:hypothetical protein